MVITISGPETMLLFCVSSTIHIGSKGQLTHPVWVDVRSVSEGSCLQLCRTSGQFVQRSAPE